MTSLETPPEPILARFGGAQPPAPAWFTHALAQAPERSAFDVDAASIELLTWGERGRPGLLFLHGDSAHADWWSFIAPFFQDKWRCAAISWSGMGRSGHREKHQYTFEQWAREAVGAIDAAGFDAGERPIVIAHSLGSYPAMAASADCNPFSGIISIDSAIIPRELIGQVPRPRPRAHRRYETPEEAIARFRFMPASVGDLAYTADIAARRGLVRLESEGVEYWQWAFDPEIWNNIESRNDNMTLPLAARCPVALIVGERSELIRDEIAAHMRGVYPPGTPMIAVPEAGHHIMMDQPLALVAALRAMLAQWPMGTART